MLIHRLIFVCLVWVLGIGMADAVARRCIPTTIRVKAEFFERSEAQLKQHFKIIESSSRFRKNYEKLATSAEISASYGAFSGSAKAAYEGVTDVTESNSGSSHVETSKDVKYHSKFIRIQRVITTEVSIDGSVGRRVEKDLVDSVHIDDHETDDELRQRGEDYIRYNFGYLANKAGATLRGNVYEASACVPQDPVAPFLGKWEVKYLKSFIEKELYAEIPVLADYFKSNRIHLLTEVTATVKKISKNKVKIKLIHKYNPRFVEQDTQEHEGVFTINGNRIIGPLPGMTGTLQADGTIRWNERYRYWKRS